MLLEFMYSRVSGSLSFTVTEFAGAPEKFSVIVY